jgi:guanylate kinase
MPSSTTIFIAADVAELERRLRERATESTGEIGERIKLARYQLEQAHRFRYMVRNDDLTRASEVLAAVVERELQLAGTMARR